MQCPHCTSQHCVKCGFKMHADASRKQRWQCLACGHYFLTEYVQPMPKPCAASLAAF